MLIVKRQSCWLLETLCLIYLRYSGCCLYGLLIVLRRGLQGPNYVSPDMQDRWAGSGHVYVLLELVHV